LESLIKNVETNENINLFLNSQLETFSGFVGNFKAKIKSFSFVDRLDFSTSGKIAEASCLGKESGKIPDPFNLQDKDVQPIGGNGNYIVPYNPLGNEESREIDCGIVVVATGGVEYKGEEFGYGTNDRVITQLELEDKLYNGDVNIKNAKEIVMIQCVGSRNEVRPYCSRVCCTEAIKNALKIKEVNPDARVIILYRDIRTYGLKESYYTKAREKGILFIRYEKEKPPVVEEVWSSEFGVRVFDPVIREEIELKPDLLVLSMATLPHPDNEKLAPLLKVPLTKENFFLEAHMKLRPVDFASEGIFLCGLAHYPKFIEESIAQAEAVASRANTILSKKELTIGGAVAVVNEDLCATCLTCVRTCPYNVPRILDRAAHIEVAQCQGCGTCASECPNKAIQLLHYTDDQLIAEAENFEAEVEEEESEIPSPLGGEG